MGTSVVAPFTHALQASDRIALWSERLFMCVSMNVAADADSLMAAAFSVDIPSWLVPSGDWY